jgi:hypothetical protein
MALNSLDRYKNLLNLSNTAYTPNVSPTSSDISNQIALMREKQRLAIERNEQLKTDWYPDDKKEESRTSFLTGALRTLGAPMSIGAGAVEYALGKGTERGLVNNIVANVKEGGTYGDIIRSYGVSNSVAMPLGFALDVMMDPINWATVGTGALVPRVATGLIKGAKTGRAIEGAALGLKSGLLQKAETVGKVIPGLAKKAFSELPEGVTKRSFSAETLLNLSKKSTEASKQYRELIGDPIKDLLLKSVNRPKFFEKYGSEIRKIKVGENNVGEKIADFFGYNPAKQLTALRAADAGLDNLDNFDEYGSTFDRLLGKKTTKQDITQEITDGLFVADNGVRKAANAAVDSTEQYIGMSEQALKENRYKRAIEDEVRNIIASLTKADDIKSVKTIARMTKSEREELATVFQGYKSSMERYNNSLARILLKPGARKALNIYSIGVNTFKSMKIGLNPSTWMNAAVGNLAMTGMVGVDIANSAFIGSLKKAVGIVRGVNKNAISDLLTDDAIMKLWDEFPTAFSGVLGVNVGLLRKGARFLDDIARDINQSAKESDKIIDIDSLNKIKGWYLAAEEKIRKGTSSVVGTAEMGIDTTLYTSEIVQGPYRQFLNTLEQAGKEGVFGASAFHTILTKPLDGYSKIDQAYRLGFLLHLSQNGVNERELLRLAARFKIDPKDVAQVANRNIWKISPNKALDIVNETYMNYLAMPGFVQMMRTLPIVGMPFFSFTYGMGALTAKTALYNPSYFNKIQFLLKEISGRKSPLEKLGMEDGQLYEWYNREGMTKLPFFEDNPVYLNVANMIPYYSLNMFQPSERTFNDRFGGTVAALIDKTPFFKDPVGQVLFDYIVLPSILQNEEPKGLFDQPLYPRGSSALQKTGYAARSLAEAFTPPIAGLAGLVVPWGESADSIIPLIPNYRFRSLAWGKRGKTSVGVESKEAPEGRVGRILAGMAGWPTYKMNLEYVKRNNK